MVGCDRLVTVQRHPGLKGLKGQTNQPKGLKTNRQTGGDWFYWLAAIIRQNMVKKHDPFKKGAKCGEIVREVGGGRLKGVVGPRLGPWVPA